MRQDLEGAVISKVVKVQLGSADTPKQNHVQCWDFFYLCCKVLQIAFKAEGQFLEP